MDFANCGAYIFFYAQNIVFALTLDTPLVVFLIDWKGWKEQPTYDLSLNNEWLDSPSDLEEGKEFVKNYLISKAAALTKFIEGL